MVDQRSDLWGAATQPGQAGGSNAGFIFESHFLILGFFWSHNAHVFDSTIEILVSLGDSFSLRLYLLFHRLQHRLETSSMPYL